MPAKPNLKPLDQQAIIITGATSGIGLSTARRAAKAGACVFLIARGESDLKALVEELQQEGARVAYAVATARGFQIFVLDSEPVRADTRHEAPSV